MSTLKQIEANRLNAQHSTGPRSEEGKRASSQNALKSGLDAETQFVLGETRQDFARLQTEWYDHHVPVNPEERLQVDAIIRSEWFLRRYFRIEAQLWEYHFMEAQRSTGVELGEAFSKVSLIFMRFQRRITLAEKSGKEARANSTASKPSANPKKPTPKLNNWVRSSHPLSATTQPTWKSPNSTSSSARNWPTCPSRKRGGPPRP